ncbi:hypothetical protein [Gulosibacter sp. 10]|uniref:hypothetical protein n=1 Tax=Gulosibacter sp. 10 TaxID=1255570 RepID=UPI00097F0B92|nr:hypothetical protein [Gulosibacter sp. 10]SJM62885.1 hypothetical protein FM112_08835 [Gulosibacter sp. 10]
MTDPEGDLHPGLHDAAAVEEPFGASLRGILSSGLAAAAFLTVGVVVILVFVAFAQALWSLEFWSGMLFSISASAFAWVAVVHTPVWLLVERRGWNRYACIALEAVALVPLVLVSLAFTASLTGTLITFWLAVLLLPALAIAFFGGITAKHGWMRRRGWLLWAAIALLSGVGWLLSGASGG